MKSWMVLLTAAVVIALPFIFRRPPPAGSWREGDPVIVAISPHNEAIRHEFASAFSRWHEQHHGRPVKIDWRVIGGTTEIARYLTSEMQASFRAWWLREGKDWPQGGTEASTAHRFSAKPGNEALQELRALLRSTDDPNAFGTGIDLFFGGGEYDHSRVFRQGLTVPPNFGNDADSLFRTSEGIDLIPLGLSGEIWRAPAFFGTALSTFGIVYNPDRLRDLGVETPPSQWRDLADPRYIGQLGIADPTKSGSIAKAFEMMIHQQCIEAVRAAGFDADAVARFEKNPAEAPPEYEAAIAAGWVEGIRLVRLIGANARYFTDSASKVPIDVSTGNAAVGLAIDFYGRYQAETSRGADGKEKMFYVTPVGGSSVSADPISLLRGAPNREVAVRFIRFALSEEGQRLWNYRPGTPGGPEKFALRRLPIRRDFYPSDDPGIQAAHLAHLPQCSDNLADPSIDAYRLAEHFTYTGRWTGRHFGIQRHLIRAMALDAGDELRAAWAAIQNAGGPEKNPRAMEALLAMPPGLDWHTALDSRYGAENQMTFMREWILFFREQYRLARTLAENRDA
jgi:iron(III) transport system substrate-binding protein